MFEFNSDKNKKLIAERNIGFEDIISILEAKGPIAVIDHPNKAKYPSQKIYLIEIDNYIYIVPFERKESLIRLITIFPSHKMTNLINGAINA